MTLEEDLATVVEAAAYEQNWDGEGARTFSAECLSKAELIIRYLHTHVPDFALEAYPYGTINSTFSADHDVEGRPRTYFWWEVGNTQFVAYYRLDNVGFGMWENALFDPATSPEAIATLARAYMLGLTHPASV
jgi:hypothetical protein